VIPQGVVDLHDLPGHGSDQVVDGLNRFHHAEGLSDLDLRADFRELHEDDVGQLGLGVVGDSDPSGRAVQMDPLVGPRVATVLRDFVGLLCHQRFLS
jgi:hypothetical protein